MAVELSQVTSISDFIQTDHFSFEIPALPGGGDREAFIIRNLSAVLPTLGHQVVSGELHRFKIHRAGKPDYGSSFNATYMDATDKKILDGIHNWQSLNSDPETGLPNPAATYLTTGICVIYGMDNRELERRVFHNLWLAKADPINLNGATPGMMNLSLTFQYDYWTRG